MEVGIVGKPNIGKSTFFSAATLSAAEIASYPFTTIKPNVAVGYAITDCPCKELQIECAPNNSKCKNGKRLIPVQLIDVAGLVPGAHEGKGLGCQFLDDLRQAHALIHILDISGSSDDEGKSCKAGDHDPANDVKFLEDEIDYWFLGIVKKQWDKLSRQIQSQHEDFYKFLAENLAGIGILEDHIRKAIKELDLDIEKPNGWDDDDLLKFTRACRRHSKPIVIAANKCDISNSKDNFDKVSEQFPDYKMIPCSAESELALVRAADKGLIKYTRGDSSFEIVGDMDEKQKKALGFIKEQVMDKFGSTGVEDVLNTAVFDLLELIPVYPVEDENKFSDKNGNALPDVYLMPKGSTAIELAYKVHTSIGDGFITAINCRTKRKIGKEYELQSNDIIKIVAKS
ncbi:redox-regulated ATPase YchF [Candidatus Undinarchaeota archaeon]